MTLSLFAECALAGCRKPSDEPGAPCPACWAMFADAPGGWTIRRSETGTAETAEQVAERKAAQLAAQALAATPPPSAVERRIEKAVAHARGEPERRQNQTCWMCEDRRTCTKQPGGWECDACLAIV